MPRTSERKEFAFLNVRLPKSIVDRLNDYSSKSRIPKVAITEFALNDYLDKVAPTDKKEQ